MSSATSTGAVARAFASRGAVCSRSQTSHRLVAVHAQQRAQPREPLAGCTAPGVHVDVVRGPDGGQHLPLAVADLAAHGGQRLGPDDAVGGEPEEGVAFDHLQVEQPAGDARGTAPARTARSSARAAVSPGAPRPARLSPSCVGARRSDSRAAARAAGEADARARAVDPAVEPPEQRQHQRPDDRRQHRLQRRLAQAAVAALGRDLRAHDDDQERRQQAGDERRRRRAARCRCTATRVVSARANSAISTNTNACTPCGAPDTRSNR